MTSCIHAFVISSLQRVYCRMKTYMSHSFITAAPPGFEPRLKDSKSSVLPLHHGAKMFCIVTCKTYLTTKHCSSQIALPHCKVLVKKYVLSVDLSNNKCCFVFITIPDFSITRQIQYQRIVWDSNPCCEFPRTTIFPGLPLKAGLE